MRRAIYNLIVGAFMFLIGIIIVQALTHSGFFAPDKVAVWDFTKSRAPSIVAWPTDERHNKHDWWASGNHEYKHVTIVLPDRPKLISVHPPNVFFDRKDEQIIRIKINEVPVTQQEALERLRSLAKEWGWPWEEAEYAKWTAKTTKGDNSRIGAGDRPSSNRNPFVSASIIHAAATPERPWYVQLEINWPEALPPPYGTMK
jgi:hypothetical protein